MRMAKKNTKAAPWLSIVLPTYNERQNLEVLIPELEQMIRKQGYFAEIVVVDDSSKDGTPAPVNSFQKKYGNIRLLERPLKEGLGAALRAGYNFSRGRIILSMDSDLSVEPEYVPKLLNKLDAGFDFVVGSRHTSGSAYDAPSLKTSLKKAVSTMGNALILALIGLPLRDCSMNFRAMKANWWRKIKTHEKRNAFLFEMIFEIHRLGGRVGEIPFRFKERRFGKSKMVLSTEVVPFLVKAFKYAIGRLRGKY